MIIAYASLPTAKPNSFTASIEMVEEMMLPLPISMCTIAFTEPVSIDFHKAFPYVKFKLRLKRARIITTIFRNANTT